MTRSATLTHIEIERHVARGRLLHARAVRAALRAAVRLAGRLARGIFVDHIPPRPVRSTHVNLARGSSGRGWPKRGWARTGRAGGCCAPA